MPNKKNEEINAVEAAAPVAAETKTAAKKPVAEKKTPVTKKAAEKKTPGRKKTTDTKKTASAAAESKVVIQALGSEVNTDDLVAKSVKASGVKAVKKVDVYVKPEVNKVYYVINGDTFGDFDLF